MVEVQVTRRSKYDTQKIDDPEHRNFGWSMVWVLSVKKHEKMSLHTTASRVNFPHKIPQTLL